MDQGEENDHTYNQNNDTDTATGTAISIGGAEGGEIIAKRIKRRSDLFPGSGDFTTSPGSALVFQVLSWYSGDAILDRRERRSREDEDDEEDAEDNDEDDHNGGGGARKETRSAYYVKMFGVTKQGASVAVTAKGYRPEFYVRVPQQKGVQYLEVLKAAIKELKAVAAKKFYGGRPDGGLLEITVARRKTFWGFTNGERQHFLRLVFHSQRAMKGLAGYIKDNVLLLRRHRLVLRLELFESNIDPLLRFVHKRGISPAGWVRVPTEALAKGCDVCPATRAIALDATVYWEDVHPADAREGGDLISPMVVASFDIECNSSHGDFPVAVKSYRKLAGDMYDFYTAVRQKCRKTLDHNDNNKNNAVLPYVPDDFHVKRAIAESVMASLGLRDESDLFRCYCPGSPDVSTEFFLPLYRSTVHKVHPKGGKISTADRECVEHALPGLMDDVFCVLSGESRVPRALRKMTEDEEATKSEQQTTTPASYANGKGTIKARTHHGHRQTKFSVEKGDDASRGGKPALSSGRGTSTPTSAESLPVMNAGAKAAAIVKLFESCGFPELEGDEIIQIGTTFHRYGEADCCFRHIVALGSCDPVSASVSTGAEGEGEGDRKTNNDRPVIDSATVSCATEREVLLRWSAMIGALDPDVVMGYNVFGFDFAYLHNRAQELGICSEFMAPLSRLRRQPSTFEEKDLSSSAMGENKLKYFEMPGRVVFDLYKLMQRDHKLVSHSLDNVAKHFLGLQKNDVSPTDIFRLQRGSSRDRKTIADYCLQDCALCNRLVMKLEIIANNLGMANVCYVPFSFIFMRGQGVKIFSLVARQCMEDGFVIPTLHRAEDRQERNARMLQQERNSGFVSAPNLRTRTHGGRGGGNGKGKGRARREVDSSMREEDEDSEEEEEDEEGEDDNNKYEGAIVLDPKVGIYTDDPVTVLDYASLYPSSMMSENISHDCLVMDSAYDNLPGVEYVEVTYDTPQGPCTCRFAQIEGKGVLPRILMRLLGQRKAARKLIALEAVTLRNGEEVRGRWDEEACAFCPSSFRDEEGRQPSRLELTEEERATLRPAHSSFQRAVLDGLQNAYKVTANSLYGQMGAKTSPLYLKHIAASTTATGRNLILKAKNFMETQCGARVIYGDTDSLFMTFDTYAASVASTPTEPDASPSASPSASASASAPPRKLKGKEALGPSIESARRASALFKPHLKPPHDMEYEKTFWPFLIFSKKRYVGNMYEDDPDKFKQKSMGIVLKRRDNAPIVKNVYGGVLDILLNKQDLAAATAFLRSRLDDLASGKVELEELVVSKTLKSGYAVPEQIPHNVLAQRIGERDPGNKPQSNDRVPYVYIKPPLWALKGLPPGKKPLQGNCIEDPKYIRKMKLEVDYAHYITNQIMKPVLQVFAVMLENVEGYRRPKGYWQAMRVQLAEQYDSDTITKARNLVDKMTKDRRIAYSELKEVEKEIAELLRATRDDDNRNRGTDTRTREVEETKGRRDGGEACAEKLRPLMETKKELERSLSAVTDPEIESKKQVLERERDGERDKYVSKKYDELREKEAKKLLFDPVLNRLELQSGKMQTIRSYFSPAVPSHSHSHLARRPSSDTNKNKNRTDAPQGHPIDSDSTSKDRGKREEEEKEEAEGSSVHVLNGVEGGGGGGGGESGSGVRRASTAKKTSPSKNGGEHKAKAKVKKKSMNKTMQLTMSMALSRAHRQAQTHTKYEPSIDA